jgi:hypothetical protein
MAVAVGSFSDGDETNDGRNAACHCVCAHVDVLCCVEKKSRVKGAVISARDLGFARARKRQSSSSGVVFGVAFKERAIESRDRSETVMVRDALVNERLWSGRETKRATDQRANKGGPGEQKKRKRRKILSGLVSGGSGVARSSRAWGER